MSTNGQAAMKPKYPLAQVRGGPRVVGNSTPGYSWQGDLLPVPPDGKPIHPRGCSDTFRSLSRKAKISVIPPKYARHTSITLMRSAGVHAHHAAMSNNEAITQSPAYRS